MKEKIQFILRMVITYLVLRMVYQETGIWTVVTLSSIIFSKEILAWLLRDTIKKEVRQRLEKWWGK